MEPTPHESALHAALDGLPTNIPIKEVSDEGLRWGNFMSRLGPLAFMQVMTAGLTFILIVMFAFIDNKRANQMDRIHLEQMRVQERLAEKDERATIERINQINAINSNTQMIARMETAVMDRLLGLKRDAEKIKNDIKDVKENPATKDTFGARPPRPIPTGVEILPLPEIVIAPDVCPDPDFNP